MTRGKQILEEAKRIIAEAHERGNNDPLVDLAITLSFTLGARWADKNPHWISIEEELPKQNEPVLVYNGLHEFIFVGIYSKGNWFYTEPIIKEEDNITHWCHLPQPPVLSNSENIGKDLKGGEE